MYPNKSTLAMLGFVPVLAAALTLGGVAVAAWPAAPDLRVPAGARADRPDLPAAASVTPTPSPPVCTPAWNILPSPAGRGFLAGIAPISANDVWAVGSASLTTLTEHWDG